jgi:hypothetical protein
MEDLRLLNVKALLRFQGKVYGKEVSVTCRCSIQLPFAPVTGMSLMLTEELVPVQVKIVEWRHHRNSFDIYAENALMGGDGNWVPWVTENLKALETLEWVEID